MKSYFNLLLFAIVGAMVCFAGANANGTQAQDGYIRMNFSAKPKHVKAKAAFAVLGYLTAHDLENPIVLTAGTQAKQCEKPTSFKNYEGHCLHRPSAGITFVGTELLLHAYADDTAPIKFVTDSRLVKYVADQMPEDYKNVPKEVSREATYLGISLLVAYCAPIFIDAFNSN